MKKMKWKWILKILIFLVSGFGFWIITGDKADTILLIVILSILEFRYATQD